MNNEWKYKISSAKTPVILMLLMSTLFVALTLWLYNAKKREVVFLAIITIVMLLALLFTIYRFIFYKVLINSKGFYYQTGIGNGKFYSYTSVKKAWLSSGTSQNGINEHYCNISLDDSTVIRFPFFHNDKKSVKYLVKKIDNTTSNEAKTSIAKKDEYLIDGKAFGKSKIIVGIIILTVLASIDTFIIKEIGFNFIIILSIILGIAAAWLMFNYYLFFQVKIEKNGFYYRTNLFNGHYYKYNEISSCQQVKRVVKQYHQSNNGHHKVYYFYFIFIDNKGQKHKFQFEQQIYEHEINILKERIETARKQETI